MLSISCDGNDMRSLPIETRRATLTSLLLHMVCDPVQRAHTIVILGRFGERAVAGQWEIGRVYPTCWQNGERRPKRRPRGNTPCALSGDGTWRSRQQSRAGTVNSRVGNREPSTIGS
jgi:hypothetical protein